MDGGCLLNLCFFESIAHVNSPVERLIPEAGGEHSAKQGKNGKYDEITGVLDQPAPEAPCRNTDSLRAPGTQLTTTSGGEG